MKEGHKPSRINSSFENRVRFEFNFLSKQISQNTCMTMNICSNQTCAHVTLKNCVAGVYVCVFIHSIFFPLFPFGVCVLFNCFVVMFLRHSCYAFLTRCCICLTNGICLTVAAVTVCT